MGTWWNEQWRIVNVNSCRKCAEFSPVEMRLYKREFQYQGCKLWSLLNSMGYRTINSYIHIYIYFYLPGPCSCHASTIIGDKVWTYGVFRTNTVQGCDEHYQLNMVSLTWTEIQCGQLKPPYRFMCSLTAVTKKSNCVTWWSIYILWIVKWNMDLWFIIPIMEEIWSKQRWPTLWTHWECG